jgi:hypothetical protein
MKTDKILLLFIIVGLSLAILCIGLRLLPGIVAFVVARELAQQAGFGRDFVFACAVIAAWVALAFVFWIGLDCHENALNLCFGLLHYSAQDS